MINVDEKDIDKLTESVYKILQGETPPLIILSENFPENEIKQFVKYFNKLLSEYDEFQNIAFSISRGELNSNSSKSKLKVVQSIKSVQSNLRHLTWKTQKIANGDFSQKVDFMGDFSDAFNSMTKQLKEAFDVVKLKNKKLSQQNEEIAAQKDEINEKQVIVNLQNEELHYNNDILLETLEIIRDQKLKIEEAHENIQQSIYYARLIQVAVLPTKKQLREILPKHFILFKPRDIVSGDFFWIRKRDKYVFLAAADCSGHGIPGAFMSMLGVSLLNEIVVDPEIKQANEVLDELRKKMKITLHQNGKDNNSKDGMDIAFCIINTETKELQYSGA
ncbi:MAG: SpoIIE family protein phosphatase, partial [Bacteroidales bacterium]|nr:SpoIIE family protein phosphatase [Bacteroidales bacterium]